MCPSHLSAANRLSPSDGAVRQSWVAAQLPSSSRFQRVQALCARPSRQYFEDREQFYFSHHQLCPGCALAVVTESWPNGNRLARGPQSSPLMRRAPGALGGGGSWARKLVALAWSRVLPGTWTTLGPRGVARSHQLRGTACGAQREGTRAASLTPGLPHLCWAPDQGGACMQAPRDELESVPCREPHIASNCFPRQVSMKTS